jgi:hypothetical protein
MFSPILQEFVEVADILTFLSMGAGLAWLVGVFVARVLENFVFWHNIPSAWKKFVVGVISAVFGFVIQAVIIIDITQYLPAAVVPFILAIANWYFGQNEYGKIKDSEYAASARLTADNLHG